MFCLVEIITCDGDVIIAPMSTLREIRKNNDPSVKVWTVTLEPMKGVKAVYVEVELKQKEQICRAWADWLKASYE